YVTMQVLTWRVLWRWVCYRIGTTPQERPWAASELLNSVDRKWFRVEIVRAWRVGKLIDVERRGFDRYKNVYSVRAEPLRRDSSRVYACETKPAVASRCNITR